MSGLRGPLVRNGGARVVAIVSLAAATVIIGRAGGPEAVGLYVLLRVVPSLCAVVVSCGLPAALPYFLAGDTRRDPRLRPTLLALLGVGSLAACGVWLLVVPLVGPLLFKGLPRDVLVLAGVSCTTQLWLAAGRGWLQGIGDLKGGDLVVAVEEIAFLPAFAVLGLTQLGFGIQVVGGLILADLAVAALAWWRLWSRRALRGCLGAPSVPLARRVVWYGARGQTSALLTVLNLRLDVAILGALAGPAVVGAYAVASKYAELLRLPGLAATYVLYPAFSRQGTDVSARRVRPLARRALLLSVLGGIPLMFLAAPVLTGIYGSEFEDAVLPAKVLVFGLLLDGAAGVVTAWLYGAGKPGLTSLGAGAGVVVTVALDVLLIPSLGALGAAIASAGAYFATAAVLWWCFQRSSTSRPVSLDPPALVGVR